MYEWTPDDDEYPSENNDFNPYVETVDEYLEKVYDDFYNPKEEEDNK